MRTWWMSAAAAAVMVIGLVTTAEALPIFALSFTGTLLNTDSVTGPNTDISGTETLNLNSPSATVPGYYHGTLKLDAGNLHYDSAVSGLYSFAQQAFGAPNLFARVVTNPGSDPSFSLLFSAFIQGGPYTNVGQAYSFSADPFQLELFAADLTINGRPFGFDDLRIRLTSLSVTNAVLSPPFVFPAPLPASAPMFGAALLVSAGFGYGMNRWVAPSAKKN